jgi:NAD(P)-dependent dehydrogenase (short-subunit alcohol dehydrogenase family)
VAISLEGQVAIITGAGTGLGRAHAMALAERGAKVVINDLPEPPAGPGSPEPVAATVAREIHDAGGQALVAPCDVSNEHSVGQMVTDVVDHWGRVDILINNAGILRDKSFGKSDLKDFRTVMDVHLMGSVTCSRAVWPHMLKQRYGRILMTTSGSGIYGNFGQANYGAAKSAVVGLMNVLAIEGQRKGIRVNALAPTAATQMTEDLLEPHELALLDPESVSPGAVFMVSPDAPTQTILAAGAGVFAVARMEESAGIYLPQHMRTPDAIAEQWTRIADMTGSVVPSSAAEQTRRYLDLAHHETAARVAGPA